MAGSEYSTRSEADDVAERVERFRTAWLADHATDLELFLPAPPAPHRPTVVAALIKLEMELRAVAGLPVRAETYLGRYRWDLTAPDAVAVVATEYRLRHKFGDKPRLTEFRSRFPEQFDALSESISRASKAEFTPPPLSAAAKPRPGSVSRIVIPASSAPAMSHKAGETGGEKDTLPADLNYKLIRKIGQGAFGEVHEAEAPGGFRVAIKRIIRDVAHPASQGEIEALEAIKAINHPFLLQTQAYWVFDNHIVIVMELADGSLTDRIEFHKKEGRPGVPAEELIPLFEQAAEALDYLHSQKVSHRDVKPQNILLSKGYAKVADFGLARDHEHTLTHVGAEVGTPVYMAPEVWKQRVSLHSDQYSLAASYIQARLGRPLFATRVLHELAAAHCTQTPDLDPLPEPEQQVLLKALSKRPDDRYPTCLSFAKALRAAVMAQPESVKPPPPAWRAAVLLAAGAVAAGLGIGALGLFNPKPAVTPTDDSGKSGTQTGPVPKEYWLPKDWQPDGDVVTKGSGGREYYQRLTREVAGEKLVAILVPQERSSDPPTFYMLENKITNRAFRELWSQAKKNPNSQLVGLRRLYGENAAALIPEVWENGVVERTEAGEPLGSTGAQAGLPVLGVTVPQAMLAADELRGQLPTVRQWQKATGAWDDTRDSPVGTIRWYTRPLLALNLLRPRLVRKPRTEEPGGPEVVSDPIDVSMYGIRQLVSNGFEWTGDLDLYRGRVPLLDPTRTVDHIVRYVGQGWDKSLVLTIPDILKQNKSLPWNDTDEGIGFRVVLEP